MSSFPGAAAKCGCQQCDKVQCCDFSISISNVDWTGETCAEGFLNCGGEQAEFIEEWIADWSICIKGSCLNPGSGDCGFASQQVEATQALSPAVWCTGGPSPVQVRVEGQFCCVDSGTGYKWRYVARSFLACLIPAGTCWIRCTGPPDRHQIVWESPEISAGTFTCPGDIETWTRVEGDSGDMETANA